ncbi:MAG: hypothetical protein ACJ8F1_01400 [Polyangia bacterium]
MHIHSILSAAALLAALTDPSPRSAAAAPAEQHAADQPEALRALCHNIDLCWLIVLTPPTEGAFLVEAKFPNPERFVRPEDAYCDRREYWHVIGNTHTLLAVDCEEQWGPDAQGPVHLAVQGKRIKLSYLEWQYDRDCESASATIDLDTARVTSVQRWAGAASSDGSACRRSRPLKALPPGDGKTSPLVRFRTDDVRGVAPPPRR